MYISFPNGTVPSESLKCTFTLFVYLSSITLDEYLELAAVRNRLSD